MAPRQRRLWGARGRIEGLYSFRTAAASKSCLSIALIELRVPEFESDPAAGASPCSEFFRGPVGKAANCGRVRHLSFSRPERRLADRVGLSTSRSKLEVFESLQRSRPFARARSRRIIRHGRRAAPRVRGLRTGGEDRRSGSRTPRQTPGFGPSTNAVHSTRSSPIEPRSRHREMESTGRTRAAGLGASIRLPTADAGCSSTRSG